MTPERFRAVGQALRGPHWQRAIAADLGLDERLIRYWVAGERLPIPDSVRERLGDLLQQHATKLMRLAQSLNAN